MKAFLILLTLIISNPLQADELKKKSAIFHKIITSIVTSQTPKVYLHTEIESLKKYSQGLALVNECQDADLVIISSLNELPTSCEGKLLFGTKYSHLRDKRVIGAFFWQKGRPNIIFYKNRLEQHSITLNNNFLKYIEEE